MKRRTAAIIALAVISIFFNSWSFAAGNPGGPLECYDRETGVTPGAGAVGVPACNRTPRVVFVPLDSRPVCFKYVVDTANYAGINIVAPPFEWLPKLAETTDTERMWKWLEKSAAGADAMVLSADMMIYGGLVASRRHEMNAKDIAANVARFEKLKKKFHAAKIFAFSTIMRTPKQSVGGVEPDYYEKWGPKIFRITALLDRADRKEITAEERAELSALKKEVPAADLSDWLARRGKNLAANIKLMRLAAKGAIDHLVICRDDCYPYSRSRQEYRELMRNTRGLSSKNFSSFAGADELGMLLVSRAANFVAGAAPRFAVRYAPGPGPATIAAYEDSPVGKSVEDHISAAGGTIVPDIKNTDFIMFVNTSGDGRTLEAESPLNKPGATDTLENFVTAIGEALDLAHVAVADISCSNGADNAFMKALSSAGVLGRLAAYSGWNTAGNTIGYAIGQAMLSPAMNAGARKKVLFTRYMDDWAYQSNIRKQLYEEYLKPAGKTRVGLSPIDRARLVYLARRKASAFINDNLREFGDLDAGLRFPWNRLFEAEIRLQPEVSK